MPAFGKKGLGTFSVSYHETFDFFWIKGPLRCKANNFFGYDLEERVVGIFQLQGCSYPLERGRHILYRFRSERRARNIFSNRHKSP